MLYNIHSRVGMALIFYIFMYWFTKYVHIGFVFSGRNKKKNVFNTAGDVKGKLDKN